MKKSFESYAIVDAIWRSIIKEEDHSGLLFFFPVINETNKTFLFCQLFKKLGHHFRQATVQRLNRLENPDITVILGDILDDGLGPKAAMLEKEVAGILSGLYSPFIAIPGNHDGSTDSFYTTIPRSKDIIDIKGIRFLPFIDKQEPEYNASRSDADIKRFERESAGFDGKIIALQHVPLLPPGRADCPYKYLNADKIIKHMQRYNVTAGISGYYHPGLEQINSSGIAFITAPALCESPFNYAVVCLDEQGVDTKIRSLALPPVYELFDWHVHTQFAYCSTDMEMEKAVELADEFGLKGLCFAEHSGQLFFSKEKYWGGDCLQTGINGAVQKENRMRKFLKAAKRFQDKNVKTGLEIDFDFTGKPVITSEAARVPDCRIGAVHALKSRPRKGRATPEMGREFLMLTEAVIKSECRILAHPFRVFRRSNCETPEDLFLPVVEMLEDSNTAAEINFHTNEPPLEFFRLCLDRNVKLSFGSDARNLFETGDFALHLDFLEKLGITGNPEHALLQPD